MRKSEKDLTEHRAAQTAVEEGDDRETSEGEEEEEEEEGGWEESNEEYCFDSDGSKAVPVANSGTIPLYDDASEGSALVYPVWGQASSDYETEEGSSPPRKRQKRESECGTCTSPETSQYCTTEASSDDMAESEKVMDCPQNAVVTLDDLQLGWLAVLKAADLPITENDAEKKAEGKFLEVLMERNQTRAVDIAGRAIEVLRCVAEGMTERKKKIWEKFRSKKKQQGLRIWKQSRSQPTLTAEWERSLKHAEKQLRNQLLEFVKTHCEGVPSTKEIIKGCLYALEGRLEDISRNRFRLDIANLEEPPEAPAAKPQQPRENGLYSGDYHRQSSGNLGCEALEASTTVVFDPEEVCIGDLLRIQQQSRCYTAESLFVHGIVVSIKGSQGGQEGPKDVDKVAIEVVVAGRQPSVLHLNASDFQKGLVHKIDKQKFGKTGLHVLQGQAAEYTSQRSELAAEKDVAQILAATEIAEEGKKELARLVVLRRWARQPFASFHGARGLAEMSVPHRTKLINICWDRNAFQKPVVLERSIVAGVELDGQFGLFALYTRQVYC
ncbi:unnamed protein product [Ostreobium quekettii]|uniref:DUF7607 domain-containing protein n=1 Tax=Ostreobium quekettii TaxID=121088 RepID=A0A8S1J9L9_9CHLO|nr:unnamed protein product [Ostreobium quekettii]